MATAPRPSVSWAEHLSSPLAATADSANSSMDFAQGSTTAFPAVVPANVGAAAAALAAGQPLPGDAGVPAGRSGTSDDGATTTTVLPAAEPAAGGTVYVSRGVHPGAGKHKRSRRRRRAPTPVVAGTASSGILLRLSVDDAADALLARGERMAARSPSPAPSSASPKAAAGQGAARGTQSSSKKSYLMRKASMNVMVRPRGLMRPEDLKPLVQLAKSQHIPTQQEAMAVVATLALNEGDRRILVDAGFVPPLLELMGSPDISVAREATAALTKIVNEPSAQRAVLGADGLGAIIASVVFKTDSQIRYDCASALLTFAAESAATASDIVALDGADNLLRLARSTLFQDKEGRRVAAHALECLASHEKAACLMAGRSGVLHDITLALKTKDVRVQTRICNMLTRMCMFENAAELVLEASMHLAMVEVILERPKATGRDELKRAAVRTLARLSTRSSSLKCLCEPSVMQALIQSLEVRWEDVHTEAARALANITARPDAAVQFVEASGLKALLQWVASAGKRMRRCSSRLLHNLTKPSKLLPVLFRNEVVPILLNLIESFDTDVQAHAAAAIARLATLEPDDFLATRELLEQEAPDTARTVGDDDTGGDGGGGKNTQPAGPGPGSRERHRYKRKLIQAGVVHALVELSTIENHRAMPHIARALALLLTEATMGARLVDEGAITCLLRLATYARDDMAQYDAVSAINNLLDRPEAVRMFASNGALPVLRSVAHSNAEKTKREAEECLEKLAAYYAEGSLS